MPIIITSLLLSLLVWIIKDKHLKMFSFFSCVLFLSLYVILYLPREFDLFRHYRYFDLVKDMSFMEITNARGDVRILLRETPGYLISLWIISKLKIKVLLPVFTGIIIYGIPLYIINDEYKDRDYSRIGYNISFDIIFLTMDYVAVSGLRNMFAFCLFFLGLYYELFNKHSRLFSWILYIIAATFHSTTLILIALRLILLLYNRITKWILSAFLLAALTISPQFINIAYVRFKNVPIVSSGLWIGVKYFSGFIRSSDLLGMRYSCLLDYIFVLLVAITIIIHNRKSDFNQLNYFVMLCFSVAIGLFGQYDTFVRMRFIFIPLLSSIFMEYYQIVCRDKMGVIYGKNILTVVLNTIVFMGLIVTIIVTALYRFIYQYYPLTQYFKI